MKTAEYPERTCREPVSGEYQMYSCEIAELHEGPCASYSSRLSVQARQAWEAGQQAKAEQQQKAALRVSGRRRGNG